MEALRHRSAEGPASTLSELLSVASRPLARVLAGAPAVFAVKDLLGRYVFAGPAMERLVQRPARFVVGRTDYDLFPRHVANALREADRRVLLSGRPSNDEDAVTIEGEERAFLTSRFPVVADDGRTLGIGIVAFDATELRRSYDELARAHVRAELINAELREAVERLEKLSSIDRLTGAWNRARFEEAMAGEISRADRYGDPAALIFFDIDRFKQVNDVHGHQAGDGVLVEVCRLAREVYRSSDALARWGGEEFVLLAAHTTLDGARLLAERLRERIEAHEFPAAGHVTASFGVAALARAEGPSEWLGRADAALYRAKRSGRNCVVADWTGLEIGAVAAPEAHALVRLTWQDAYGSGHDLIDLEHRNLFRLANDVLSVCVSESPPPDAVKATLRDLVDHVVDHFAHEERVLAEVRYPALAEHRRLHATLADRAVGLLDQMRDDPPRVGGIVQFAAYELVALHFLGADRRFFRYLNAEANRPAAS